MAANRGDRSGKAGVNVDIPGLKGLAKAIRESGPEARKAIRGRMKTAGRVVVAEIARRTPVGRKSWKGHRPGTLQKATSARPGVTSVRIVNTALARSKKFPKGYRYGKRIEFDPAIGGTRYTGRYFYPGFAAKKGEAIAEIAKVLDDVGRAFAQGG